MKALSHLSIKGLFAFSPIPKNRMIQPFFTSMPIFIEEKNKSLVEMHPDGKSIIFPHEGSFFVPVIEEDEETARVNYTEVVYILGKQVTEQMRQHYLYEFTLTATPPPSLLSERFIHNFIPHSDIEGFRQTISNVLFERFKVIVKGMNPLWYVLSERADYFDSMQGLSPLLLGAPDFRVHLLGLIKRFLDEVNGGRMVQLIPADCLDIADKKPFFVNATVVIKLLVWFFSKPILDIADKGYYFNLVSKLFDPSDKPILKKMFEAIVDSVDNIGYNFEFLNRLVDSKLIGSSISELKMEHLPKFSSWTFYDVAMC